MADTSSRLPAPSSFQWNSTRPALALNLTLSPSGAQGQCLLSRFSSTKLLPPSPPRPHGYSSWFMPTSAGSGPPFSSWQWAASEGLLLSSHLVKGGPVSGKFSVQTSTKKGRKKWRIWEQTKQVAQYHHGVCSKLQNWTRGSYLMYNFSCFF